MRHQKFIFTGPRNHSVAEADMLVHWQRLYLISLGIQVSLSWTCCRGGIVTVSVVDAEVGTGRQKAKWKSKEES